MGRWSPFRTWIRRVPRPVRDVLVAVAVVGLDLVVFSDLVLASSGTTSESSALSVLAVAGLCLVLLLPRRRFPVVVALAVCAVSAVAAAQAGFAYRPVLPVCLALGTVTSRRQGNLATLVMGASVATSLAWAQDEIRTDPKLGPADLLTVALGYVLMLLVAAGIGRWARQSRERARLLDERRREEGRQAVAVERLRLARELHDIVSHAVTVMVLQASGARRVMAADPGRAEGAMATVEETGGRAMTELRRLLGVLRADDDRPEPVDGDGADGAPLQLQLRGLDDLAALVETARASGLEVEVETRGERGRLDASVDLAAFRVVQEGLTNVIKHAGPGTRAHLTLAWSDDSLVVELTDDGRGPGHASGLSTGYGLLGLRERVSVAGGQLSTRFLEQGFEVRARLPVAAARPPVVQAESR